ncbi:DNA helicase/exodeoxyribonuclease V, alpha subunit [Luteibacter sp. UNC138MFCol5.1]|uniref:exodeoxyribonuclease V subunit alpha n=1 Tax=Luteibacter sp. UNC138MFCol5.1 TaxID=1502774 RepID=UPI0008BF1025|nr:exodeoxyribonuclease V subunit alpha [Luteibacter sp. UNC138MFCol5.1]SEO83518.1 DNA helicase/exodeoxyribonuclease V, alpha subunit [Luteibacter sp. UNC138MFCol5.1]
MTADIGTWLDRAVDDGRLRRVDRAFARFLATLDPQGDPRVLAAAALASRELGEGHICVDVRALPLMDASLAGADDWLAVSPLVGGPDGDPATPLVLDAGWLYLRRFWRDEASVAAGILARLDALPVPDDLGDELDRLFAADGDGPDWQKIACAIAVRGSFAVITGGPGTGKTTTVVRLLGLLQTLAFRNGMPRLRVRLAAPTGKAAARLNASIAGQIERLDVDDAIKQAIPAEVTTLHRLLGSRPDSRAFRHDRDNPLHLDVLVIDEASMIDLEMMSATLDALPAGARLVLLGDKDQLSSVEAGAVLGDLCARADRGHYDAETRDWLARTCGVDVAAWTDAADARPLDQHVAMLRRSRRFGSQSGIGALAAAINAGDAAAVRAVFAAAPADIAMHPGTPAAIATLAIDGRGDAPGYAHYLRALEATRPAADAADVAFTAWGAATLRAYARFQLLCAVRHGEAGVEKQNARIAQGLLERGLIDAVDGWYEGRPVMVTRNDYALGLMNGDVGITLWIRDAQGGMALRVAFSVMDEGGGERIRFVVPSRLAAVETVYAMTVHKSQGSEFEHTALALPAEPSPVLTRELVYTGVTRARSHFTLLASPDIFDHAVRQKTQRASGLLRRLSR